MGYPVLIIGESGTGKSTALRNLDPQPSLLVQAIKKPLPFRSANWKLWDGEKGSIIVTDNWEKMTQIARKSAAQGKDRVIFDDYQYLLANEFMRRSDEKGYQKFTDIGRHAWEVIMAAQNTPCETRFYFLMHSDVSDTGMTKAKTIGKMLDDKITLEGMFTVVLRTQVIDGQYYFTTKNNGFDTVKSPLGLFEQDKIENDLDFVDKSICDYYGIESLTTRNAA